MTSSFRWRTEEADPQQVLFAGESLSESRKGIGEFRGLEFLHVKAKSVINEVPKTTQMPFRFTINAYRGCSHACVYCFARPTHAYLNLNVGTDFDTKIVVKVNAVERVRAELRAKKWGGDGIAMGTNTDPYQRAEGKYQLTRGIIKALSDAENPFSILTKSTLILRDIDLLVEAAKRTDVQANFSIATLDADVWRSTEPGTPHPAQRIAALKKLTDAGVTTGVLIAPLLPGISDLTEQVSKVIDACVAAGASWIAMSPLHLKSGVKEHWMQWLGETHPELVSHYQSKYADRSYLSAKERDEVAKRGSALIASARRRQGVKPPAPAMRPTFFERSLGPLEEESSDQMSLLDISQAK